ncbi:uncharacterized protein LOC134564843 [Prinia subflava]|uniref:uncharacterized protein LOC134564843 n=1 Tax=Prinia subflava TaxID=208062 RepID=UPI002FE23399
MGEAPQAGGQSSSGRGASFFCRRAAGCVLPPLSPVPFNGAPVRVMGRGIRGAGGAGAAPSSPPHCRERKPAASSAVTGTRVLLLLSAAAGLLLHPIIIRGGCEKRKTQTKHTQTNNLSQVTVTLSPRSAGLAGPAALPWPWGGELEPGRRGKNGAGQTQGLSLLSPARRAAQGLGAAAAGAPCSPLRSRRHRSGAAGLRGSAPASGQLAGSSFPPPSPPLLLVLFLPFRRRGSPTRTHAAPRPRFNWVQPEFATLLGIFPLKLGSMSGKVMKPKEEKDACKVMDDAPPGTQEYIMLRQDSIQSAELKKKESPFRAKCHEIFCCPLKQVHLKENTEPEGLWHYGSMFCLFYFFLHDTVT